MPICRGSDTFSSHAGAHCYSDSYPILGSWRQPNKWLNCIQKEELEATGHADQVSIYSQPTPVQQRESKGGAHVMRRTRMDGHGHSRTAVVALLLFQSPEEDRPLLWFMAGPSATKPAKEGKGFIRRGLGGGEGE